MYQIKRYEFMIIIILGGKYSPLYLCGDVLEVSCCSLNFSSNDEDKDNEKLHHALGYSPVTNDISKYFRTTEQR